MRLKSIITRSFATSVPAALSVLLAGGILAARLAPAAADDGDKTGWSVMTDPRHRAFLIYVPKDGAARLINIACLRDVDMLTVISEGVPTSLSGAATLSLSNGNARYDVAGAAAQDPVTNLPTFTSQDLEGKKAITGVSTKLVPVLQGPGPILYALGAGSVPPDLAKNPTSIPVAGLAAPLTKFKSVCFGG